jgi:hypothetical protein
MSSTAGKFGKVSKWTPEENGDDHILDNEVCNFGIQSIFRLS